MRFLHRQPKKSRLTQPIINKILCFWHNFSLTAFIIILWIMKRRDFTFGVKIKIDVGKIIFAKAYAINHNKLLFL